MAGISMQTVDKRFGKTDVIQQVDLEINDGEFAVFVGPSGCGKSTLLRLIAGLEEVSSGTIQFDGQDITSLEPSERGVAMVFQSYALYPHMSVYDNMAFGLKLKKTDGKTIKERVQESARILQIEHLLDRKPKELSGGQRQRVAIGRAIVRKPRVFLFDEPLSNLDAALRVQMRLELKRLHRELGTTMIYVTHDQVEAMTLADRIVVLNGGKVEQVGSPQELYHHPANIFVAGFIGSPKMNFIRATVSACADTQVTVNLNEEQRIIVKVAEDNCVSEGARIVLGVRPEHIQVMELEDTNAGASVLKGKIVAVEHLGSEAYIHIDTDAEVIDGPLVCRVRGDAAWVAGQTAAVNIGAKDIFLFDEAGKALYRPKSNRN